MPLPVCPVPPARAAGLKRHAVAVRPGDRHVLDNGFADTAKMQQRRGMLSQPLVCAIEHQPVELDPPRSLGQHEMPASAIDQPRRAGHTGDPGAVRQVDVGHHETAWRQPQDPAGRGRVINGALKQPALVIHRIGQQPGKVGVKTAAQADLAEKIAGSSRSDAQRRQNTGGARRCKATQNCASAQNVTVRAHAQYRA